MTKKKRAKAKAEAGEGETNAKKKRKLGSAADTADTQAPVTVVSEAPKGKLPAPSSDAMEHEGQDPFVAAYLKAQKKRALAEAGETPEEENGTEDELVEPCLCHENAAEEPQVQEKQEQSVEVPNVQRAVESDEEKLGKGTRGTFQDWARTTALCFKRSFFRPLTCQDTSGGLFDLPPELADEDSLQSQIDTALASLQAASTGQDVSKNLLLAQKMIRKSVRDTTGPGGEDPDRDWKDEYDDYLDDGAEGAGGSKGRGRSRGRGRGRGRSRGRGRGRGKAAPAEEGIGDGKEEDGRDCRRNLFEDLEEAAVDAERRVREDIVDTKRKKIQEEEDAKDALDNPPRKGKAQPTKRVAGKQPANNSAAAEGGNDAKETPKEERPKEKDEVEGKGRENDQDRKEEREQTERDAKRDSKGNEDAGKGGDTSPVPDEAPKTTPRKRRKRRNQDLKEFVQ